MATAETLFTQRAAAGAAYQTAVADLQVAWVALSALDQACQNRAVLAGHPAGGALVPVRTFVNRPQEAREGLLHAEFLTEVLLPVREQEALAAANVHVRDLGA